ncbi:5-formyltetrahydrofolate cyclo-ligase [Fusarium phyllophilum]|uniref:5-formyltetrahydrofolate cyclo-ligase n=1 Tax=Fusarium phyllophilum TaxID=47803 RepID=A0A8H5K7P3_9HYPO|nr:5-formyltetrahydrofolate cyclo-ligase [Fusarium phyllophilum]
MASSLPAAKQQLRSLMKQKLSKITQDSITTQSRCIFETLKEFQPYKDARRVSIYLSMPTAEVQTDAIVRHALSAGKQVFVPYLHKSPFQTPDTPARVMDMVHLKDVQDYESLKLDKWGIPSVDPTTVDARIRILGGSDVQNSEPAILDFMVVPGVAFDFDQSGSIRRLGHGKGFYDFFINRYMAKLETKGMAHDNPLHLYGLALTEQMVPATSELQIPTDTHDRRLNGLVLGNGEVKAGIHEASTSRYPRQDL